MGDFTRESRFDLREELNPGCEPNNRWECAPVGDLRNKARKWAEEDTRRDREQRKREGWTIFHHDFNPSLTRRDMTLGEAIRHLLRVTGCRMSFWRCPVRGLAVQIRELPHTPYSFDKGETWMMLHFSDLEDQVAAKKVLALDMLLTGIGLYRGLPNAAFDEQVATIKYLLTAPPSVPAEDWLKVLEKLHPKIRPVLRSHESDLRTHLLGAKHGGTTGPVALTVRPRLEEMERGL